ncbi:hypothetical protein [Ferrovibrio sp.]|uniref:hypothetical protein n=1 Tax=Ferrovibrio sp. TaxID=1917215 RepID=UPI00263143F1|nr:hypothetical protein [Ferrovibrio sp.]
MHRLVFILVLFGIGLLPAGVKAQDAVLWLKTEWPPVFTSRSHGFGDQALGWLLEHLPGYAHHVQSLPLGRLLKTMERQDITVCASGLARTPAREGQFLISHDFMHMPALALVVRADDVRTFGDFRRTDGSIEMRRLLSQDRLKGGINDNRSYGAMLDALLQSAPLVRLAKTSNMVSMLAAKRLDWVLLYPFEATWQARQEKPAPDIAGLPITDIPSLIRGGITCSRTTGGQRVIDQIDQLILDNPARPWMAPMLDWLDPETRRRQPIR